MGKVREAARHGAIYLSWNVKRLVFHAYFYDYFCIYYMNHLRNVIFYLSFIYHWIYYLTKKPM